MPRLQKQPLTASCLKTVGYSISRAGFSWPLLFASTFYLVWLYQRADSTLLDPDTHMHITIGNWILKHQAIPYTDIFSFTKNGAPWVAHEWLSDIALAVIYNTFGWTGLHILTIGIGALVLSYILRFQLDRKVPPIYALLFAVLSATCLETHLLARPHLFTWPILAFWFGQLLQAGEQRQAPPYALILLVTLWANLHGSFVLGLVLIPPLAVDAIVQQPPGERLSSLCAWSGFLLLAIGATLVTPWGWESLHFAYELLTQPTLSRIDEWGSVSFAGLNAMEIWIMALLSLTALGLLRLNAVRLPILLALLYEGLAHVRYMSIFGLLTPMLIALPFREQYARFAATHPIERNSRDSVLDTLFNRLTPPARPGTIVLSAAILVGVGAILCQSIQPLPPAKYAPTAALASARQAGLTNAPVFNDYPFGGYLISQGIPVYIDGRADMYGSDFLQNYFDAINPNHLSGFSGFLDAQKIEWTLLPPNNYLVDHLSTLPGWQKIHSDEYAVIHRRVHTQAP